MLDTRDIAYRTGCAPVFTVMIQVDAMPAIMSPLAVYCVRLLDHCKAPTHHGVLVIEL